MKTCRELAGSALRSGLRTIVGVAMDRSGATIIDYGLLLGLVALAMIGGAHFMGDAVAGMFDMISTGFVNSMPQSG